MMRIAYDTYYLTMRALRETMRQPAFELPNVFIPIFFFAVTVGAIGSVAARAFGVDNFMGFQMPVAILQGVAGAAGSSGLGMVTDIQRGYFDKLLLTPASRMALVLGRMAADGIRVMALTLFILVVGLISGAGMEAGVVGFLAVVVIAGLFGLAYAGIGMSIALRTGSPQASQAGFLVFFPLLFLSPAFAPKEVFAGWLEFLATINPVTYILQGMRELVLEGWDWGSVAGALAAIVGLAALTVSMTLAALRWRTAF
jgi:ABC-2 type transport system permease protein